MDGGCEWIRDGEVRVRSLSADKPWVLTACWSSYQFLSGSKHSAAQNCYSVCSRVCASRMQQDGFPAFWGVTGFLSGASKGWLDSKCRCLSSQCWAVFHVLSVVSVCHCMLTRHLFLSSLFWRALVLMERKDKWKPVLLLEVYLPSCVTTIAKFTKIAFTCWWVPGDHLWSQSYMFASMYQCTNVYHASAMQRHRENYRLGFLFYRTMKTHGTVLSERPLGWRPCISHLVKNLSHPFVACVDDSKGLGTKCHLSTWEYWYLPPDNLTGHSTRREMQPSLSFHLLSELRERHLPSGQYEAVTRRAKNQSFKYWMGLSSDTSPFPL